MKSKHKWIIPLLLLVTIGLVGCSGKQGKEATNAQQDKQVLTGVYKISDKYNKTDDGTPQPHYWYFKKNGKLLYCKPQVNSTNQNNDTDFWYGDAYRGTWKSLGNNMFELKIHDVYDNDYYTIKEKLNGSKLHTYANSRNAKYKWYADDNYKQPDMTYSDFIDMFNKAKDSDQKGIQENGYTKPDNDSSSDNSSESTSSNSNNDSVKIEDGNDALEYFKQQKDDQDAILNGGTFGMSDNPHASITGGDGNLYYVYQDGKIEEQN